jgi:hypothetical protein
LEQIFKLAPKVVIAVCASDFSCHDEEEFVFKQLLFEKEDHFGHNSQALIASARQTSIGGFTPGSYDELLKKLACRDC